MIKNNIRPALETYFASALRLHRWFQAKELLMRQVLFGVLLLSTMAQIVDQGAMMWNRSQPLHVLRALDDDEANGVAVALRTRIYNDSDFHTYGVLYYRVVHLVQHMLSPVFSKVDANSDLSYAVQEQYRREAAHDFTLDFVSLISLYGIAFMLAWLLTRDRLFQVFLVFYLVNAITQSTWWSQMLFAAKPDVFLCLLVLGALIFSWRACLDIQNHSKLRQAAIAWGLAFSTKLVALYFLPVLLAIMVGPMPWVWSSVRIRAVAFLKIMMITYFGVGFPNNFTLIPPIKNLLEQSSYLRPIDIDFFAHWWSLWWEQIRWPLLVLALGFLLVPSRSPNEIKNIWGTISKPTRKQWLFLLLSGLLPTLWLFSKKTITFHQWYPLPFVTAALGFVALIGHFWASPLLNFSFKRSPYWLLLLFFVLPYGTPKQNGHLQKTLETKMACVSEAKQVGTLLWTLLESGKVILADPMIPYNSPKPANPRMYIETEITWDLVSKIQPNILVFKTSYDSIFFPIEEGGSAGMVAHLKDLEAVKKFYRPFRGGSAEIIDPSGAKWRKIHSDACTWEIWERL